VFQRSQYLTFLRRWVADPLTVGAVMPSSPVLAGLMANAVGYTDGRVLELGPGTGVFTEALLARGLVRDQLTLVELDECFADLLSERFPGIRIVRGNAARLSAAGVDKDAKYDAIVSGLPLLSMSARSIYRIVRSAALRLEPSGHMFQFTYGIRCPVPAGILLKCGLKAELLGSVIRNIPPASVYRISHSLTPREQDVPRPLTDAKIANNLTERSQARGTSSPLTTSRSLIC
jgi:phospholipid N-methyltransferase